LTIPRGWTDVPFNDDQYAFLEAANVQFTGTATEAPVEEFMPLADKVSSSGAFRFTA
jgi:hypothetical protein